MWIDHDAFIPSLGKHMGCFQYRTFFCRHNPSILLRRVGAYRGTYLTFSETANLFSKGVVLFFIFTSRHPKLHCVLCLSDSTCSVSLIAATLVRVPFTTTQPAAGTEDLSGCLFATSTFSSVKCLVQVLPVYLVGLFASILFNMESSLHILFLLILRTTVLFF